MANVGSTKDDENKNKTEEVKISTETKIHASELLTCPQCQKVIEKSKTFNGGRHCSRQCSDKAPRTCAECKKQYQRTSNEGLQWFCSNTCAYENNRKAGYTICPLYF